ncbi:MAG TPA: pseudouridine synthase [Thermoanaerobaculia bacterium]|jgi:23S rRNA pseudouridine2605 synthase|nr:pseudouridine synthase [Thermoanaerobaculia bacterium]
MSEDRLQKILARAGVATSRRKAEELIQEGRVTINGKVAELGEKADPERDAIKVDSRRIQPLQEHHYFLLNKPKGVMSTVTDPEGRRTVIDFVPPGMRKALVPVGRLDFNTEGLLLLTDDGEFAQRVAHPRYGSVKTYEVKVKGLPTEAQLEKLRAGMVLDGKRTAPARITARAPLKVAGARRKSESEGDNSWWIVELTEGRTRQIREMFFNIGHGVLKLRRVAIGTLRDRALPVGALRSLTEQEVHRLLKSTGRRAEKKPAAKKAPARKAPASAKSPSAPPRRAAARKPAAKRAAPRPGTVKRAGARKEAPKGGRPAPKPRQGRR